MIYPCALEQERHKTEAKCVKVSVSNPLQFGTLQHIQHLSKKECILPSKYARASTSQSQRGTACFRFVAVRSHCPAIQGRSGRKRSQLMSLDEMRSTRTTGQEETSTKQQASSLHCRSMLTCLVRYVFNENVERHFHRRGDYLPPCLRHRSSRCSSRCASMRPWRAHLRTRCVGQARPEQTE